MIPTMIPTKSFVVLLSTIAFFVTHSTAAAKSSFPVTHGVGAGEATHSTVVIWSRTNRPAFMHVCIYRPGHFNSRIELRSAVKTSRNSDFTSRITVTGLTPYTYYKYVVCFSASEQRNCDDYANKHQLSSNGTGFFHTAAAADQETPLKLVWSGDLAGQNVCRHKLIGFPIFNAMHRERPHVVVFSGDMVYADNRCEEKGLYGNVQVKGEFKESSNIKDFRAHWRYNREDKKYLRFLRHTNVLATWDDHEIINDAGPSQDTIPNRAAGDNKPQAPYVPDLKLTPLALQSMYEWNPFNATVERPRHYGSFRYGKHVEVFRLDTRLYRDANLLNDTPSFPKTMLGLEQKQWFQQAVRESDATWKVIQCSVPISIPTGSIKYGRDGWTNGDARVDGLQTATDGGFKRELTDIVATFKHSGVKNTVWITADVHFATAFQYPAWGPNFVEVVAGPLNAGLFPITEFDRSLGGATRLFGPYGPKSFIKSLEDGYEKAVQYFNYGVLDVKDDGILTVAIKNTWGKVVFSKTITPVK